MERKDISTNLVEMRGFPLLEVMDGGIDAVQGVQSDGALLHWALVCVLRSGGVWRKGKRASDCNSLGSRSKMRF